MTAKEAKFAFTYRAVPVCAICKHLARYKPDGTKAKFNENGRVCCEKMTEMVGERVPIRYDFVCDAFEKR